MINIENLNTFFFQEQVLYDIAVHFPAHAVTAIIGPSGGGKTTLLKSINRTAELMPGYRHCGKIYLHHQDVFAFQDVAAVRRLAGMVLQKPVALPFSIKENVLFGPRYYGKADQSSLESIVESTLTEVGLWPEVKDKLSAPARELSGGQLQRLAIARILAVEPQVLLLDEPCSSLDINATRLIEDLLLKLSRELTIIIVTHNLNQARRVAAATCFMQAGHVIEHNSTEALFAEPRLPATQDFLANY